MTEKPNFVKLGMFLLLAIALVVKLEGDLPQISGPETQWLTLNFRGVYDTVDTECIRITLT